MTYTGIDKHYGGAVGLFDTALSAESEEFEGIEGAGEEAHATTEEDVKAFIMPQLEGLRPEVAIHHRAFGYGKVLELTEDRIKVRVGGKDCTFMYPGTFVSVLMERA